MSLHPGLRLPVQAVHLRLVHPRQGLPGKMTGWNGLPFVPPDGASWPAEFAAELLGMDEELLRMLLRKLEVEPAGVIRMSSFSRKGRQPMAYPAKKLIMISEDMIALRERLKDAGA